VRSFRGGVALVGLFFFLFPVQVRLQYGLPYFCIIASAEDSRLRRGGQLLGYKDVPAVSGLVPAWRRRGAYKM
jgi:hypothetical protein